MKLFVKDQALHMNPTNPSFNSLLYAIPKSDFIAQTQGNQTTFKIIFKQKFQDFLHFLIPLIGWKPRTNNSQILCEFPSELNRDIVLLEIAQTEAIQRFNKTQFTVPHFPTTARNINDRNGKITARDMQKKVGKSPNKSQTSISPTNGYQDKFQKGKYKMKNSFTGATDHQKKKEVYHHPTTPQMKPQNKNKQRQYLNVFEDEDLQFLNATVPTTPTPVASSLTRSNALLQKESGNDGPSINLRGSFQQLQKSFNSNLNQDAIDKAFGIENNDENKTIQEELNRLRMQNHELKKQVQVIAQLTKENNSTKRKYLQMKEEVNRLEMQRKAILTQKLRSDVNWHNEIKQKQAIKKELEQYKQLVKSNSNGKMQRSVKVNSFHEQNIRPDKFYQNRQNPKEMPRSPNHSYYH